MAFQDSKGLIRGAIGDMVFRVVNGKQVIQQRPKNRKRTEQDRERENLFSKASKQAAEIRGRLKPWLGSYCDSKMVGRFHGSCLRILNDLKRKNVESPDLYTADLEALQGFEFNINSPTHKYFLDKVCIDGTPETGLRMYLNELNTWGSLSYPRNSENVDLHLIVLHIPKDAISNFTVFSTKWMLPRNKEIQESRSFEIGPIHTEGITLVLMQLLFFDLESKFGRVYKNDENLHPAKIIYAK